MDYNNIFKPRPGMSEKDKKQLHDNILSAFPFINITIQQNHGKISALEINAKIIFKDKDNSNGKK